MGAFAAERGVRQRTELSVKKRLYITATSFFATLGVIAIAAISYAALALAFVRRRGLIVLGPVWLLGSVTATAVLIVRTAYERSYYTLADAFAGPFPPVAFHLLLMCALGFGAVTLLVARRQQRGKVAFGMGLAAGSVGACLFGVILFMLAIGLWDWATF